MEFLFAIPFVLILFCIAIFPLAVPHFWESNRNKVMVIVFLATPVLAWLMFHEPSALMHSLEEYLSFIILLGSLFTISGGIAITGDLQGTPRINTLFLAIGAVLANLIGTTGASMVLIRAFVKTNSERRQIQHLPVFFIFIVANCGGLLTPLGDPPLFLGFLRGVPFFWTLKLFPMWLAMNGALLVIFYFWDLWAYRHETKQALRLDVQQIKALRYFGLHNLAFLAGVIGAVFFPTPWREILMLLMAFVSFRSTRSKRAQKINHFTWHPIAEVAILFFGIFVTMIPALQLLKAHAPALGLHEPWHFFWSTGLLSGFLDNAPTYLTFLSVAQGLRFSGEIVGIPQLLLVAISLGAVFMGALTYIGNGPNFMIKAICEHAKFPTPSFVKYMGYSVGILIPLFLGLTWLFF
ncbi:MAG: sodium:proton antiporter [Deltaproteobacteria bacterium]|nr:sodium:proton antiporter [Deltaproteobacteria bacterium]